ncbi:polymorphic toxin type 8 domain-containing protein [Chryseobacterium sp. MA9]|uniref:polymorphic toxin type 8 domain-containing protein n=1 Tax=Chryseobacterium sp. MA9 TaxID=2966625 RepID=UPI0021075B5D|nr:polymorphic toxin type 8 domain-containing protein [Chryseobacterium sp. MA9]UTX49575.1 hypothetical protein KIK00_04720 [Chryseobacterium sp. MA9]
MSINGTLTPSYRYSSQGQENQIDTKWSSYRWRNYDAGMARFFNIDPLSEKYAYQSHYNFSENRVVDGRELEGLEWQSTKREQDLPDDPVEFAEFIGGGINSVRAAVANSLARTVNVLTNNAVSNKYVVEGDGGLTLLTGVPKESFKEKVVNGSFDLATIGMAALGGPEGVLTMQGGKAPAIKAVEEVKNLQKAGRNGKQARLRELAEEPKLGKADKGWLKSDINKVAQGKRTTIRNPPGKDLAHERGREAEKGYSYKYSHLQDRSLHRKQHKYDNGGRKNKERPVEGEK